MVKRVSYRSYFYIAFALILLMISWESNKTNAALLTTEIPQEAIRLRILANSDSVQDQALKRLVRDAIVEEMNQWVTGPATIEEARDVVADHLPDIHQLVTTLLAERGFTYEVDVELGEVDFPTKMYGSKVYPAGVYEALKISIGSAQGQNWWCVLFPPLCFVDLAMGEAVPESDLVEDSDEQANKKAEKQAGKQTDKQAGKHADEQADKQAEKQAVAANASADSDSEQEKTEASLPIESKKQVRFFLVDAVQNLFASVKGWFA
ncbi:stage II sporulation protein R [Paenibacillus senegalensis]|uniref:stage II sporulation protein R n=1 Tax=Paenibacillus senegalensis TaxID=1465766 RepID=UPI00028962E8|nr:stage II sporulation protein R [Paenibacillus senegalensis]